MQTVSARLRQIMNWSVGMFLFGDSNRWITKIGSAQSARIGIEIEDADVEDI